jgi:glycine hydroxymethyltransferase
VAAALGAAGAPPLTGGTDTHLVSASVRALGLTGVEAERRCAAAGLMLGRCAVPYDPAPPAETSGIRLGTGTCAAQGMGGAELGEVGELLGRVLRGEPVEPVRGRVRELARAFAGRR